MLPSKDTLRTRLKEARHALGISQAKVAKQVGVSPSAIGSFEIGVASLKRETLLRYAAAVGLSEAELYAPAPDVPAPAPVRFAEPQTEIEVRMLVPMPGGGTAHETYKVAIPPSSTEAEVDAHIERIIGNIRRAAKPHPVKVVEQDE